jgi:hypothetical protein
MKLKGNVFTSKKNSPAKRYALGPLLAYIQAFGWAFLCTSLSFSIELCV